MLGRKVEAALEVLKHLVSFVYVALMKSYWKHIRLFIIIITIKSNYSADDCSNGGQVRC